MNDWDDIRFFLSVARCGSLSAASKELGVNHSTVSRRLQALEDRHEVRLFERIPSGLEMTAAASAIYELALELEATNYQISRKLLGQDRSLKGEINLTMPHDIFECCLSDAVATFSQQHPEIQINLSVVHGLKNMAAREADIAVRLTPSPPENLIGKSVASLQHGIYSHLDFLTDAIDVKHHDKQPIIVWSQESEIPAWASEHFSNPEIVMRVDDLYAMYAAVRAGVGFARIPCYLPDALQDGGVKRLNIDVPPSNWGVWVLSHVDLRHTERVRRCREHLMAALSSKADLFEGRLSRFAEG